MHPKGLHHHAKCVTSWRDLDEKQHGEKSEEVSGNNCRHVSIEADTDEEAEATMACVSLWLGSRGFIVSFKSLRDWIQSSASIENIRPENMIAFSIKVELTGEAPPILSYARS